MQSVVKEYLLEGKGKFRGLIEDSDEKDRKEYYQLVEDMFSKHL